jgi:hypothetical protein
MIDAIKKWFKLFKKHQLHRCIYAVTQGAYLGEMLVFIKQQEQSYHFLSIPNNVNRIIPKEKFDFGLQNGILQFVEKAPQQVYQVTIKQYEKNEFNH